MGLAYDYQNIFIMKHKIKILLSTLIFLTSCTENPLNGTWDLKIGQKNISFFPCKTIQFEDNLSRCAGIAEKVTYEIREKEVIVNGALGVSSIYKIKDKNTISIEVPFSGELLFNRSSY